MSRTTLVKLPGLWRSYESRDGQYKVHHSRNWNIWQVHGGPPEIFPLAPDRTYFNTLAECRAEIERREWEAYKART